MEGRFFGAWGKSSATGLVPTALPSQLSSVPGLPPGYQEPWVLLVLGTLRVE